MNNFYYFEHDGYNFRMDDWHTDDFSDNTKGIVQIELDNGEWVSIVSYSGCEGDHTLELVTNKRTEYFHESDNFDFDEDSATDFIYRNVISLEHWLTYEAAA